MSDRSKRSKGMKITIPKKNIQKLPKDQER
jgi:hypothetical protein